MPLDIYRELHRAHHASDDARVCQTTQGAAVGRDHVFAETSSAVAIMNKVALLTSSKHEPGVTIRQRSDLIAVFGPTSDLALRFQRLVAVASSLLFVYAHLLATSTLTSAVIATRLFAVHSYIVLNKTTTAVRRSLGHVWESKKVQKLRKKFFMEFATTILGPGGNMLIVMVFWPGWLLILGFLLALRTLAG
ncbi:hypothetical protein CORC01_01787 [Colletotrichum orchidophilum]|uniref:Uncharacterized protein n=1 Tax=Colletotrichum orchidophilum TaxID=1209926 RepID=A0A1G4BNK6_9PEZI|nr:uncharacterized protein CORC01_01787 [Colletotrichum orchidophilum]OHF03029.1 hypothetical protein CORC01_01787 [Colletotrichum orchidophilum]